jgi:hypothetical protein
MNLEDLLQEGRLEQRATSKREIDDLLMVIERSLGDAAIEQMSLEGRFNRAYDAALLLATIPLRCAGYRTRGEGHHHTIFDVLPEAIGEEVRPVAHFFQKCRKVRNLSTYSRSGIVARGDVIELITRAREFRDVVHGWLQNHYPQYC